MCIDLNNAKIIRVTLTVDYLVDTDRVTQLETWLTDFPLHQSHAARDWWRLGNSKRYVSHQVLSVREAYNTER
jgi:hypothetical protein